MEKRRIAPGGGGGWAEGHLSFLMSVSPKLSTVISFMAKNYHENSWIRLKDVQNVGTQTKGTGQLE
jgi:hypothetical protein